MTILATTRRFGIQLRYPLVSLLFLFIGSFFILDLSAEAQEQGSPRACQAYSGDAHIQCLHIYIEMQEKRIAQMEGALHGGASRSGIVDAPPDEPGTLPQDSQPASLPPAGPSYLYPAVAPGYAYAGYGYAGVPYAYPAYGGAFGLSLYPGLGLTLGFGGPGYYGRPFYSPRYIYGGPGFYRPGFYRPRFYGPRIYGGGRFYSGPRSFGPRSFSRPYGSRSFGRGHR